MPEYPTFSAPCYGVTFLSARTVIWNWGITRRDQKQRNSNEAIWKEHTNGETIYRVQITSHHVMHPVLWKVQFSCFLKIPWRPVLPFYAGSKPKRSASGVAKVHRLEHLWPCRLNQQLCPDWWGSAEGGMQSMPHLQLTWCVPPGKI